MKRKEVKKGSEINCLPCKSILQGVNIEGKVFFDSWEGEDKCFVSIPKTTIGLRFMIKSENLILEE